MGEMRAGRVETLGEAEIWLSRRIEQQAEEGLTMWAVELLGGGQVVGACGVFPQESDLELAYIVDYRHQGLGYATEAATMVQSALSTLADSRPVYATIRPSNAASCKVAERLGLRVVEERHDDRGVLLVYRR